MYDVIIIGAGVSGSAIARSLSKYEMKIAVLEKEVEVCSATSKANSGIVHAGYDAKNGSLKAKLNVEGNKLIRELKDELDIPYINNGSLVVCKDKKDIHRLYELKENGEKNGVTDLVVIEDKEEIASLEKNIDDDVVAVLYAKTGGIVCPFNLNIALAENSYDNGAEYFFNTEVVDIYKADDIWNLKTKDGEFQAKYVVNAGGVFADELHNMVSKEKISITARKGEYFLLDKSEGDHVSKTIFTLPTKFGKGVLVAPTVHGNLILGPTSYDIEDKNGIETTKDGLKEVEEKSKLGVKNLDLTTVITSFAGLRATGNTGDFIIGEVKDAPNFFDCAGIESPGLTSCIAIGDMICDMIVEKSKAVKKENFIKTRKQVVNMQELDFDKQNEMIAQNSKYGNIICRCERVSEGEIVDAINRPLGARTVDGIKRRVRATAGRCQGGFCTGRILEIMERELDVNSNYVTKNGGKSNILI